MSAPDNTERFGLFKPFLEHLNDLRRALVWSASALVAGMAIAGWFAPQLLALLKRPLHGVVPEPDKFLRAFDVTGGMSVAMQTIFWGGLLLSAPVIVFSICWFVFPGLTRRERRAVLGGLVFAAVLFMSVMLPVPDTPLLTMRYGLSAETSNRKSLETLFIISPTRTVSLPWISNNCTCPLGNGTWPASSKRRI